MDNGLVPRRNLTMNKIRVVLILIVVDNGLVLIIMLDFPFPNKYVLILIVVDNGLVLIVNLVMTSPL